MEKAWRWGRLTDTGYEVMEDFLGEEGVVQASEVELQNASDGVHVVIILIPRQRVLTYRQRGKGGGRREKKKEEKGKTFGGGLKKKYCKMSRSFCLCYRWSWDFWVV